MEIYQLLTQIKSKNAGVGGKLSRADYPDPHPPGYLSNITLLIMLILNLLNNEMNLK